MRVRAISVKSNMEKNYNPTTNSLRLTSIEFNFASKMQELILFIKEKKLTSLEFSSCRIDATCWKILADALKANRSLTRLSFDDIEIDQKNGTKLVTALQGHPSLESLTITDSKINFDLLTALKKNEQLTHLKLDGSRLFYLHTSLAPYLLENRTLTSLSLANCGILSSDCDAIGETLTFNHTLTHLNLDNNKFQLAKVEKLHQLLADRHKQITFHNEIEKNASRAKGAKQKNTCNSPFPGCTYYPDTGELKVMEVILSTKKIKELIYFIQIKQPISLFMFDVTVKDGSRLRRRPAPIFYMVDNTPDLWKSLAAELKQNKSIKMLNVIGICLNNLACYLLGQALQCNDTLVELKLMDNEITPDGCESLCLALHQNTTLHSLSLSQNNLGVSGFHALSDALMVNKSLTSLILNNINGFSYEELQELEIALKTNRHLTSVMLPKPKDEYESYTIQSIQAMLGRNRVLLNTHPTALAIRYLSRASQSNISEQPCEAISGIFILLPSELIVYIALLMINARLPELSLPMRHSFFKRNCNLSILDSENITKQTISGELTEIINTTEHIPEKMKLHHAALALLRVVKLEAKQAVLTLYTDQLKEAPLAAIYDLCFKAGIVDIFPISSVNSISY